MDKDANQKSFSPELPGAGAPKSFNLGDALMMSQWPNPDGIVAWVLYSLGSAFLATADTDAVLEILAILRSIDANLAGLLSVKLGMPGP